MTEPASTSQERYRQAFGEQLHHRGQLVLGHAANATVEFEVLLGRQQLVNGVELGGVAMGDEGGAGRVEGGVSIYTWKSQTKIQIQEYRRQLAFEVTNKVV